MNTPRFPFKIGFHPAKNYAILCGIEPRTCVLSPGCKRPEIGTCCARWDGT